MKFIVPRNAEQVIRREALEYTSSSKLTPSAMCFGNVEGGEGMAGVRAVADTPLSFGFP